MTILKSIHTGNGLTLAHRVIKAEIIGATLQLQVHMYPSTEDAQADANLRWQEYPAVPRATLDIADATGSMERALAAQAEGLFAGATVVADALAERQTWGERLAASQALVSASQRALDLSSARFKAGTDNYLAVLDAQRSLYTAQQQHIGLQLAEQLNRVALFKALGGDAPQANEAVN